MSLTNSPIWFGSGATGGGFYDYKINDSLRFNDNDSAYLNRTPSSAGNRQTWTWSGWFKRGNLSAAEQDLFAAGNSSTDRFEVILSTAYPNQLSIYMNTGGTIGSLVTSQVFRDVSAWYHLVIAFDTTQATASNRVKIYVNGSQVTAFQIATYPSLNFNTAVNSTSGQFFSKRNYVDDRYYDGYMADAYMIDGTALDASSFGETKDGVWIPKAYSGSYGTNGFHLDFSNNSTATDLGLDSSGNSNDWSVNNIATTDQMPDTPTNNFCTMNSIAKKSTVTLSEGNLKSFSNDPSIVANVEATFGISSGKWYFEASGRSGSNVGYPVIYLADATTRSFNNTNYTGNGCSAYGAPIVNGSLLTRVASLSLNSTSEVRQFAFDFDDGKMWIGKNGTWYDNSGTSFTNSTGPESGNNFNSNSGFTYDVGKLFSGHNDGNCAITFNFGQDSTFAGTITAGGNADGNGVGDFKYAVPSGFLALASANLPEPTIIDGSEHFNTVLYTGNGGTQSISGLGFGPPDFVWIKQRSSVEWHRLQDTVRGVSQQLYSNGTNAEATTTNNLLSVDSDGFTVGLDSAVNGSGYTYVAWNWLAGGTASSNTDGSITSSVSANVDAGFSIVSYTGNATTNATIGHGLGVAPDFIIHKNRSVVDEWSVWSSALPNTTGYKLYLNSTSAQQTTSNYPTLPTSSVFYVGAGQEVNGNTHNMIAYCFANSDTTKVGSYTGNGSTDGPFVYTGFRPAWLMIKRTDAATDWIIWDDKRNTYNELTEFLYPNLSAAEASGTGVADLLSNGFKLRNAGVSNRNASGGNYIYLAFAENPFKYANAR